MGQKIIVKIVFGSSKDSWENFGNSRYLLKLSYPKDSGAERVIKEYISRQIGVPASKIAFQGKNVRNNWLFEVL